MADIAERGAHDARGSVADLPPFRDDDDAVNPAFVETATLAIQAGDARRLTELAGDLHEFDLGALLEKLEHDDRPKLIALMGRDFDFTALTEVDDHVREDILDELPNETIADGMRDLDTDDAVYILEDMAEEDQEDILAQLDATDRVTLSKSLDYPEGSAGRRMQSEFIAVPPFWSVGQTIDYMRETEDLPDQFYSLYVVDPAHRMLGVIPLDRVLRSKRPVKVEDIMLEADHVVRAVDDQHDVAELFRTYNLVAIPVTDESERLVGVLTFDDIVDVVVEEADAEIKALGGVKAEEEISDTVWSTAKSRFTWLFVNLLTAILASVVIAMFESTLEKMVALAVLMPIVASMGGNAGTQSMTVAVRALAMRELDRTNATRVVRREVMVGALNGVAFAVVMGGIAAVWYGPLQLGVVIGGALVITLVAAALGGILIPMALDRFGVDPAVASGPLVTTVTDVIGFFAFLGIATLWFRLG
jgi:magnesium transporter